MQQGPSSAANMISATQEIPRNLRKVESHYHIRKSPPPVPILRQINPVHTPIPLLADPF